MQRARFGKGVAPLAYEQEQIAAQRISTQPGFYQPEQPVVYQGRSTSLARLRANGRLELPPLDDTKRSFHRDRNLPIVCASSEGDGSDGPPIRIVVYDEKSRGQRELTIINPYEELVERLLLLSVGTDPFAGGATDAETESNGNE